jgi:hypothetical protein
VVLSTVACARRPAIDRTVISVTVRWLPLATGVSLDECPDCNLAISHLLRGLELDVRLISLDLWTAGWTPKELIDEIRHCPLTSNVARVLPFQALITAGVSGLGRVAKAQAKQVRSIDVAG